jgi:hypothetical protein
VRNRYRRFYSLWPEQARPRRAIPSTTAVGGLATVIVCAVAFYCIVTDFFRPVSTQEAFERTVAQIPIYATASAPTATPDYVGSIRRTRFAGAVAKVTLPIIGTSTIAPNRTPTAVAATH